MDLLFAFQEKTLFWNYETTGFIYTAIALTQIAKNLKRFPEIEIIENEHCWKFQRSCLVNFKLILRKVSI